MSLLAFAIDDLKPEHVSKSPRNKYSHGDIDVSEEPDPPGGPGTTHNKFYWNRDPNTPVAPTVLVSRYDPGRRGSAHYHAVDQFQIIFGGKGRFGRHDISPYCIHFSRAFTPYGPLAADKVTGWDMLTLRTRYDPGARHGSAEREKLKHMPDRRPWQIHKQIKFLSPDSGVSLQDLPEIKDDQGLFACKLIMAPHTRTTAPNPAGGDGQFVVVFEGSLVYDNREHKGLTVVFIKPEEGAYEIQAGSQGLQGCIFNMPQVKMRAAGTKLPAAAAGFKKWQCVLCAFSYDEALGMPEDGIPAGTPWKDVPESWTCQDCVASKSDFEMIEM